MPTTARGIDRSAGRLPLWQSVLCALASAALYICAFPPLDAAEAAWLFAIPLLLLSLREPGIRRYAGLCMLSGWCAWFVLLIWLRHVHPPWGIVGVFLVSGILALFWLIWFCSAWFVLRRLITAPFACRLAGLLGLAGLWVLLEWVRGWIFTGFPWLPLAASQWLRPALLQPAAYAGYYAVSFVLIFFNLALASYIRLLWGSQKNAGDKTIPTVSGRFFRVTFCPEFYISLILIAGSVWLFAHSLRDRGDAVPLFKAGVIQPWIPAELKWDPDEARETLRVLKRETEAIGRLHPDLILWPEAATPLPLESGDDLGMFEWVARLAADVNAPILGGFLTELNGEYLNAVYVVDGRDSEPGRPYAKQRLVPFGEYVPLRRFIPFVQTVVPIAADIHPGRTPHLLKIPFADGVLRAGPLVCYEDIFPGIARELVRNGADFLFVVTNNAWYGEEGGAYQHAAHSVLRAVESRRPVVRSGNHGWSGWIDEYGGVRDVITDETGSIYFRGSGVFTLYAEPRWQGSMSPYVRFGDWFVGLSALLVTAACACLFMPRFLQRS